MVAAQPSSQRQPVLSPGQPTPCPLSLRPWSQLDRDRPQDLHLHTDFTDGRASPEAMLAAARQAGLRQVLFSEHARHDSTYYPGFARAVRGAPAEGITVSLGVEIKVLDHQGRLDCSPDIAGQCAALVASVHGPPGGGGMAAWREMEPGQALRLEYELALAAVRHGRAHILGHPLGMAVKLFGLTPVEELRGLALACREHGKAFELNPRYCPDPALWVRIVQEAGCLVSLGSDAHGTEEVGRAWRVFVQGEK